MHWRTEGSLDYWSEASFKHTLVHMDMDMFALLTCVIIDFWLLRIGCNTPKQWNLTCWFHFVYIFGVYWVGITISIYNYDSVSVFQNSTIFFRDFLVQAGDSFRISRKYFWASDRLSLNFTRFANYTANKACSIFSKYEFEFFPQVLLTFCGKFLLLLAYHLS